MLRHIESLLRRNDMPAASEERLRCEVDTLREEIYRLKTKG